MLQSSRPADADQQGYVPPYDREISNGGSSGTDALPTDEKASMRVHRQPHRSSALTQLAQMAQTLSRNLPPEETLARLADGALALIPQADGIHIYTAPGGENTTEAALPTLLQGAARAGSRKHTTQPLPDGRLTTLWRALASYETPDRVFADASVIALPLRNEQGQLRGALVITRGDHEGANDDKGWPTGASPELTILAGYVSALLERQAHERQIAQLTDEMAAQDRMRDSFLSLAAHELRGPLTAMKGYAQLAQRQARKQPLPETLIHSLVAIEQQTNRMSEMIGELHDATRIRRNAFELITAPVELAPIAQQVVTHSQANYPQHTITLHNEAPPLTGQWDALRIEQVLRDLVDNAARYSPTGGAITLTLTQQDNNACISVRDEGIGVESGDAERIFEYLYRAPNAERRNLSGLGLGLFVSRAVVERLGGRLWLAASPLTEQGGSEFCFTLPFNALRP